MADVSSNVPKRVRAGNLEQLKRRLWRAVLTSEALLDSDDPQIKLKAVHATSQAAGVYRSIYETADLEARIAELERQAEMRK